MFIAFHSSVKIISDPYDCSYTLTNTSFVCMPIYIISLHVANNKHSNTITSPNNNPSTTAKTAIITTATTLSFTETEEVLQIGMHKVLEHVKNHNDAWPFVDPVEEDIAPRYYTIIRR